MRPKTCQRVFIPRPDTRVKSSINSRVGHSNVTSGHSHKTETLDQCCPDMKLIRPDTAADMALLPKLSGYRIAHPNAQLRNSN
jgi:hypothetical protein